MIKVLVYGSIYSERGKKKKIGKNAKRGKRGARNRGKTDSLNLNTLHFLNTYLCLSRAWKVAISMEIF